ncbi:MAG: hypothetical protein GY953_07200 [bacterium]|nr:hypothetical protein [bacterium]
MSRLEALFNTEDFRSSALVAYAMATPSKVSPAYMKRVSRKVEDIAGGLDSEEADLVRMALDNRLRLHGQAPMFEVEDDG